MLVNHGLDCRFDGITRLLDSQRETDKLLVECCIIGIQLNTLEQSLECQEQFVYFAMKDFVKTCWTNQLVPKTRGKGEE